MNRENINKVIDWLKAGAPHAVFCMDYALVSINHLDEDDEYILANSEYQKLMAEDCGSVCCIAGAAAQFGGASPTEDRTWFEIQALALKFFGIDPSEAEGMPMLRVFDPECAHSNCTPQQAAEALELWANQQDFDINFNPWTSQ